MNTSPKTPVKTSSAKVSKFRTYHNMLMLSKTFLLLTPTGRENSIFRLRLEAFPITPGQISRAIERDFLFPLSHDKFNELNN